MPDIFVFGSNLAGIHGAGAAKYAFEHHGAVWGVGDGPTGNAYALPTKDRKLNVLPLDMIRESASVFIAYALSFPEKTFLLTAVGTGYARYKHSDMAPLFKGIPSNVLPPKVWEEYL